MAKCNKCGLQLAFKKIGSKYFPVNPDGTDHYDICRSITNQKIIDRNLNFTDSIGSGYLKPDNKKMYMVMRSKSFKGKFYKETNCDCIPWEDCGKCLSL